MKFAKLTHICEDTSPPGKQVWLEDGQLQSRTNGELNRCHYSTETVANLSDFADFIRNTGPDVHLTSGTSVHNEAIVEQEWRTKHDHFDDDTGLPLIARTNDFLTRKNQAGLLVIDTDTKNNDISFQSVLDDLAIATPELSKHASVQTSSSSSRISWEGGNTGSKGLHTYFHVQDAADIPRSLAVLRDRLILNGLATTKISKDGKFLVRTIVDMQLAVPSQPIFVRASVGDGVVQDKLVGNPP